MVVPGVGYYVALDGTRGVRHAAKRPETRGGEFTIGACFLALHTCACSRVSRSDTGHTAAIINANRQRALAASVEVLPAIVVSI